MKKYIPVLFALSAVSGVSYAGTTTQSDSVDYLQMRNGIAYQVNQETPYTGKFVQKYDNGQISTKAQFKDGVEIGTESNWYPNGQMASKLNYKDGKLDGLMQTWYVNGQKKTEFTYKNNQLDGQATRWYDNGEKNLTVNYDDGQKDGLYTSYYANGKKATQANYDDGKIKDGSVTHWNNHGDKVEQLTFKNQKVVSEQTWLPES